MNFIKKIDGLYCLLIIYLFFSLSTVLLWSYKGEKKVTGDEPHYLIMANGIYKYKTLEQTKPYREEFRTRDVYEFGLAPWDAEPSGDNAHSVMGNNGLFNIHNIGLPILVGLPFVFGGILGAKIFLTISSSLIVLIAWKISGIYSSNKRNRILAVAASTIALPFIPASNQVFPDIIAGIAALTGLYWFLTIKSNRPTAIEFLFIAAIVFMPWLQIKFAATCALIVCSLVLKIYIETRNFKKISFIIFSMAASLLLLALYNNHAFGKISGPYSDGALELSKTSLMVLLGLFLDQNHGFVLANPVNLIGVIAIGWMFKSNRIFALLWGGVFLSLLVPNSLHPNWYGGLSFSGRFAWAASVVFVIPTIFGLLKIANQKNNLFLLLTSLGVILQFYFFILYALISVDTYNKSADVWIGNYSIFYFPFDLWMPALYNSRWAFEYLPNIGFSLFFVFLLISGFFHFNKKFFYLFLIFVFSCGILESSKDKNLVFYPKEMPHETGRVSGSGRLAEEGYDLSGFIHYGPPLLIRNGSYEVTLSYKSSADDSDEVGRFDVYSQKSHSIINQEVMNGTQGVEKKLTMKFRVDQTGKDFIEFRTNWNGSSRVEILEIAFSY